MAPPELGIVDNAVTDRVSKDGVRELLPPSRDIKLRAQDRGSTLVAGFHNNDDCTVLNTSEKRAAMSKFGFENKNIYNDKIYEVTCNTYRKVHL